MTSALKSDCHLPKKLFYLLNEHSIKKMKNVCFFFILKSLFVLKIFEFLSWLFGHVEKGFDEKGKKVNFKTYDVQPG